MLWKEIIGVIVIVALFLGVSYFSYEYSDAIEEIVGMHGAVGAVLYVAVTTIATIIAPINAVPLIPVAVAVWGSFATALLSLTGWVLGSMFAFGIARRYGQRIVRHFIKLEKVSDVEKIIPHKHIFLSIVLLRMALPVDLLSYGLGMFTHIRFPLYFWATLVGITPFAFIFAYAVRLPIEYQIGVAIIGVFFFYTVYRRFRSKYFSESSGSRVQ